jgi:hypothetical protein
MNFRLVVAMSCFSLAACAPTDESRAPARTICSIGKADEGRVVRVVAVYETDHRHGALLSDAKCPDASIQIGFDAAEADDSVDAFDDYLDSATLQPGMIRTAVDITGMTEWNPHSLPANRDFRRIRLDSFKPLPR